MTKKHSQWSRFGFALDGLKAAWEREASFRTEIVMALIVLIGMSVLRPEILWWVIVGLTIALVLSAELINTALETVCDALHPDIHPLIKVAKDCASGAVLVSVTAAAGVAAALIGHLFQWW